MTDNKEKLYFDNVEGPSRKTSHPNFTEHFKDDFYYDSLEEEAPFGNDNGADTLYEVEDLFKNGNYKNKISGFPKKLVSEIWDFEYFAPDNLSKENIKKLAEKDEFSLVATDQVIIAAALGVIKISGEIDSELRKLAVNAMKRQKIVYKLLGFISEGIHEKVLEDFKSFKNK